MRHTQRLAEGQHGVVGRWQLGGLLTPPQIKAALRAGELEVAVRNVYRIPGAPRSWRQASRRYKVADEHSATRLPAKHICVVDGIPVSTVERTAFDLCARSGVKRGTQVIKAAIGSKLTTFENLTVILQECGGQGKKGTCLFRALLATLMYEPSMTELEALVLAVLAAAGIEPPTREVEVGGTTAPIGRIDFLFRLLGIVIEADSKRWHGEWLRTEADHRRDAKLTAAGFHVIRTNWAQLTNEPEEFVAAVCGALCRAA
jgi:hypothetical protein